MKYDGSNLQQVLKEHKKWLDSNGKRGSRADLSWADLSKVNLSKVNLNKVIFNKANLSGSNLSGSNLIGSNLIGACLSGANLSFTCIKAFYLGKHFAFSHNGRLKIGCIDLPLEEWIDRVDELGKKNNYTEKEIELYKYMIQALIMKVE